MFTKSECVDYLLRFYTDVSVGDVKARVAHLEKAIREQDILTWRADPAELALCHAALTHFGYAKISSEELKELFSRAADMMVEYYRGDWWTPEKAAEWVARHPATDDPMEKLQRMGDACGRREMDPAYREKQSLKRRLIGNAMMTAAFCGKFQELSRICDWFDLRIEPAYCNGEVEDEYQLGILCLLSRFRSEPIPGIEEVVRKIERCRHKRPKVFLKLIDAVFDGDLAAYHEALPLSLELYHHRLDPNDITDLIAVEQSVLAEVARRRGMELPPMDERARYTLLTAQSLGFG